MSKMTFEKNNNGYECIAFCAEGAYLEIDIIPAPKSARLSCAGEFSAVADGSCTLDISRVPDGEHPIFLHTVERSYLLLKIEKAGNTLLLPKPTAKEVITLRRAVHSLDAALTAQEARINALEKSVFQTTIF